MTRELQIVSDGAGIAIFGPAAAVDTFLATQGLESRELDTRRLSAVASHASSLAQGASNIAENSGRWVKLTQESAHLVSKHGLRASGKSGLSTGVIKGQSGQVKGFVEFVKTPTTMLTNPAILTGAAGIMAQVAMQQAMDEITDYLARIDAKVEDVLRAQTDSVVAGMVGAQLILEEAMTIRAGVGRVSEVTWSKVQTTPMTIAATQAYALRQLDGLAEKVERAGSVGERAEAAKHAEAKIEEWLAVLARCFQLQDATAVLELERVFDHAPDELDDHREALAIARRDRLEVIAGTTDRLLTRIDAAARSAREVVLLHPTSARKVIESGNRVGSSVTTFREGLGIRGERSEVEGRRWRDAAGDARDRALESGAAGVSTARRVGAETAGRAAETAGKAAQGAERAFEASSHFSRGLAERAKKLRKGDRDA